MDVENGDTPAMPSSVAENTGLSTSVGEGRGLTGGALTSREGVDGRNFQSGLALHSVERDDDVDTVSDSTFDEELRVCCTPRGRIMSLLFLLIVAVIGVTLGVTQPWITPNSALTSTNSPVEEPLTGSPMSNPTEAPTVKGTRSLGKGFWGCMNWLCTISTLIWRSLAASHLLRAL